WMTNLIFRFHDTTSSIAFRNCHVFPKNLVMFLLKKFSHQAICSKHTKKVTKTITFNEFLALWITNRTNRIIQYGYKNISFQLTDDFVVPPRNDELRRNDALNGQLSFF